MLRVATMLRALGQLATGKLTRVLRFRARTRGDEEYLLSSPRNAERLMDALQGARNGTGQPVSIDELRTKLGLARR